MQVGETAIIHAATNGCIDILKLLVDSGGKINIRDNVSDDIIGYTSTCTSLIITKN